VIGKVVLLNADFFSRHRIRHADPQVGDQRTGGRRRDEKGASDHERGAASGQSGALADISSDGLEHQQALVLAALRRAGGAAVSYAEMREAGVEFPASVVSELELAGMPIERCHDRIPGQRRLIGVRLSPAGDPALRPAELSVEPQQLAANRASEPTWGELRVYRTTAAREFGEAAWASLCVVAHVGRSATASLLPRSRRAAEQADGPDRSAEWGSPEKQASGDAHARSPTPRAASRYRQGRRILASLALLVAVGALVAIAIAGATGDAGRRSTAIGQHHARTPAVATQATHRHQPARRPPPLVGAQAPPTPVSPALATDFEARGHKLLDAGQYGDAVPVLQRAVLATGEHLSACLEPSSQTCLTYAYALYDLGRALRLSGHPAAAMPILERRMQIDNQRPTVQAELELARQQAG
jgi:tetratricopeptide (TPR) repeat protein